MRSKIKDNTRTTKVCLHRAEDTTRRTDAFCLKQGLDTWTMLIGLGLHQGARDLRKGFGESIVKCLGFAPMFTP